MKNNLVDLLKELSTDKYITANQLADQIGVSQKTVRTRLNEISYIGKKYGVEIESKPRFGYRIKVKKVNAINNMIEEELSRKGLPDSTEERTNYLLAYLVNYCDYIKIEQLCDMLCVSRSTLHSSLKDTETILKLYDLSVDRKPGYGIKVMGDEFNIRRCIGDFFIKRNIFQVDVEYRKEYLAQIAKIVINHAQKYKIALSETALENLVTQIFVAQRRIQRGHLIDLSESITGSQETAGDLAIASDLTKELSKLKNINYTEDEIIYIAIYLAGRRSIVNLDKNRENIVITESINQLVTQMLHLVYNEFQIDLSNNLNFIMSLSQHMVPLDIRLKYNISLNNPILEDIKKNYIYAYTIAVRASSVLAEFYKKSIPEDEIGYIALVFALELEKNKENKIKKYNIAIVCSSGKGSSQLLLYKYKYEFEDYINNIYVINYYEINTFSFEKMDYVFTTIPITINIPVPIVEVGQFLDIEDILRVKKVFDQGMLDFLNKYYKEDQFFINIEGDRKEVVLHNICEKIKEKRALPEGFYDSVIKREELAQTAFGNLVAMPHPYKVITEETFVYVAVLKEPILCSNHLVQLVFLTAVSDHEDRDLPDFYKATTNLFLNKEHIDKIISERKFSVLMQMLYQDVD